MIFRNNYFHGAVTFPGAVPSHSNNTRLDPRPPTETKSIPKAAGKGEAAANVKRHWPALFDSTFPALVDLPCEVVCVCLRFGRKAQFGMRKSHLMIPPWLVHMVFTDETLSAIKWPSSLNDGRLSRSYSFLYTNGPASLSGD
jgi:hypothetical protein